MTNGLPILGKGQLAVVPPHLSFPKTVKSSINSLCFHSLACIRWFPLTFFPFLVKMLSQQTYSQKWSRWDTKSSSFPPSTKPHSLHLIGHGPYSFAWLGCRREKHIPYLNHLPCHFYFFSDFVFFPLHTLSATTFILFHHVSYWRLGLTSLALILLYERIWAFMGQILFIWSKGSWTQFALDCQSHSTQDLYYAENLYSIEDLYSAADHFSFHFFLSPGLSLEFIYLFIYFFVSWSSWWPCFPLGFPLYGFLGTNLQKQVSTDSKRKKSCNHLRERV